MKFSATQEAWLPAVDRRSIVSLTSLMNFCASAAVGLVVTPLLFSVQADRVRSSKRAIGKVRMLQNYTETRQDEGPIAAGPALSFNAPYAGCANDCTKASPPT